MGLQKLSCHICSEHISLWRSLAPILVCTNILATLEAPNLSTETANTGKGSIQFSAQITHQNGAELASVCGLWHLCFILFYISIPAAVGSPSELWSPLRKVLPQAAAPSVSRTEKRNFIWLGIPLFLHSFLSADWMKKQHTTISVALNIQENVGLETSTWETLSVWSKTDTKFTRNVIFDRLKLQNVDSEALV